MFNFLVKPKEYDYDFYLNLKEKDYSKYLMQLYKEKNGYAFNLKRPRTINEIIQYLKIYDTTPLKEELADKTKVNAYVEEKLNTKKYTKEVYKVVDSILDINFDELPERFILKMNNASRRNVSIYNKKLFKDDKKQMVIDYFLDMQNNNYAFASGFELQYKNIKPKLIVERLYPFVTEYQVLCSKGKPIFLQYVDVPRDIKNYVIRIKDDYSEYTEVKNKEIIPQVIELSKKLSEEFKLVRVDFMLVNNKYLFFQELTFTPYSGFNNLFEYNDKEIAKAVDWKN